MKSTVITHGYERYNYKFFLIFVIMYILTFPLIGLALHKPIIIGSIYLPVSALIYPLTFFFADIIFEVYGYQVGRQVIWCQVPGTIYYQFVLFFILYGTPIPQGWHHQDSYEYVFGGMDIVGFFGDFGVLIAFFINGYLISRWKILLNGRLFWLRCIGASISGEFIQLSIGLLGAWVAKILTLEKIIPLFFNALIYRMLMSVVLAYPATVVASLLKKLEKIDVYDFSTNFNPFMFSVGKNMSEGKEIYEN